MAGIQGLTYQSRLGLVGATNTHFFRNQQQTLRVLEEDDLLKEIEEQHLEAIFSQLNIPADPRCDGVQVGHHHTQRSHRTLLEHFLRRRPPRPEGDIGDGDIFEI